MTPLENLARIGKLKPEPYSPSEFAGLLHSAKLRLRDSRNPALSRESRFDLAYNASHALSLAALRRSGYRSETRYMVFQCLPHTAGLGNTEMRILDTGHNRRNLAEYEGHADVEERLVADIIRVAEALLELLEAG